MSNDSETPPPGGQFLVYQTEEGKLKIDVRFEGETVWLAQQHMAELFQTTKQNIGQHLKSIFTEGELVQNSVVKESFTTESGTSSPSAKMLFRCCPMFCLVVWNSSAIHCCVSHTVSPSNLTSIFSFPSSVW